MGNSGTVLGCGKDVSLAGEDKLHRDAIRMCNGVRKGCDDVGFPHEQCQNVACMRPEHIKEETELNLQLLSAAREGDAKLLQHALQRGAMVDTRHPLRMRTTVKKGKSGSNHHKVDKGLTPLMYAAQGGHLTCVMLLLDAKANIEATEEDGLVALHFAGMAGSLDVGKALIFAGADKNACDEEGRKVLDFLPEDVTHVPKEMARWKALAAGELLL
eukprot:TRINITY_DN17128_c0_g1_i1.p1 TRINITY_DN17128_c0_g1~~TRINITY_DN17128_c0_g1_i1.p1  ORF type:complete len:215 (+),score=58.35 TRINITY_DN17128_c0_g1_i1:95-739(+)